MSRARQLITSVLGSELGALQGTDVGELVRLHLGRSKTFLSELVRWHSIVSDWVSKNGDSVGRAV